MPQTSNMLEWPDTQLFISYGPKEYFKIRMKSIEWMVDEDNQLRSLRFTLNNGLKSPLMGQK